MYPEFSGVAFLPVRPPAGGELLGKVAGFESIALEGYRCNVAP
jgi:hypothetical protein